MKSAAKLSLLILSVVFMVICSAQAQDADNPPPPPNSDIAPPPETDAAVPAGPEGERARYDEGFVEKILEDLKQNNPAEAERLDKLREENPKQFRMELRKIARQQMPQPEANRLNRKGGEGAEFPKPSAMGRERVREQVQAKEKELMDWLEKNDPNKAKELAALKEKEPMAYMRRVGAEMRNYRQIIEAEQSNPALAEVLKKDLALKQKRNQLLEKIKGTTDEAKKTELTEQLKSVLGERFDLIVEKKQLKYEELKKKLEELQQSVNKSQAELENIKGKKTEQVEQYLQQLLSNTEKINWD